MNALQSIISSPDFKKIFRTEKVHEDMCAQIKIDLKKWNLY